MPATMERPAATAQRRRRTFGTAIGCLVAAAALVPLAVTLEDESRTDLVLVNSTGSDLGVLVPRPGGSVLHVAHLRAGSRRVVLDVLHPGGEVEVVWTLAGKEIGRTTVAEGEDVVAPEGLDGTRS